MYVNKNVDGLVTDMVKSLKEPLTEQEAQQVVRSAMSLVLCLFLDHKIDHKYEIDRMLTSLGFKVAEEPINRVALGHLALMFPRLSPNKQAELMALSPTDI